MEALYTAEVLATGAGRDGHVRSTDGLIDTNLALPKALGGSEDAPNPELFFASGYAACYHSALLLVARQEEADATDSAVGARVTISKNDEGGFVLSVELEVALPHLDHADALRIADKAHQVCPYSNATRGNIDVTITVVEE